MPHDGCGEMFAAMAADQHPSGAHASPRRIIIFTLLLLCSLVVTLPQSILYIFHSSRFLSALLHQPVEYLQRYVRASCTPVQCFHGRGTGSTPSQDCGHEPFHARFPRGFLQGLKQRSRWAPSLEIECIWMCLPKSLGREIAPLDVGAQEASHECVQYMYMYIGMYSVPVRSTRYGQHRAKCLDSPRLSISGPFFLSQLGRPVSNVYAGFLEYTGRICSVSLFHRQTIHAVKSRWLGQLRAGAES